MNSPLNQLQVLYITGGVVLSVGFFVVGILLGKVARKKAVEHGKVTLWPMLGAFLVSAVCAAAAIVLVPLEWWGQAVDKILMYKFP